MTVTDGGSANASDAFVLTVTAVNDAPTISDVTDKTTNEDTATAALGFTVGDVETAAASLTLSGSSSNTALVPNANIVFGGSGASRTVTITPAPNQTGTATITLTVTDGNAGTASDTFVLTVTAVNDVPTISDVTDKTTAQNTASGPHRLHRRRRRDGRGVVDAVGHVLEHHAGPERQHRVRGQRCEPHGDDHTGDEAGRQRHDHDDRERWHWRHGERHLRADGDGRNDPPTISDVTDKTTNEDTATAPISFTVGDLETPVASLTLSRQLVEHRRWCPNANIVFGGSGASRTVTITPALNQSGTATITLTVTDANAGTASDTFVLTVTAVNDVPTISDVTDKTTALNTVSGPHPFTVGDVETAAASLTMSSSSSNTTLVPAANIELGGSGTTRTVTITPALDQIGHRHHHPHRERRHRRHGERHLRADGVGQ